ncbi:MAG: PAS domain S-box protein [Deltaproteobacteria bacterium]|nr:PAS domain S-box protein [Deltaproteobacteria bacterium]MBW2129393.1 PAS domain S-box protein [Deltaproteobacteria bacterium]MBW2305021.1 PAS domain S-box protein [Deltaproteobacteria bacterium]
MDGKASYQELENRIKELEREASRRREAEAALQRSKERLRSIFEATPDPLVVYDEQGHPEYLNPAFTRVFGWTIEELKGRRIPFVPEDQTAITEEKIRNLYKSGEPVRFETRRFTKDGRTLDILISAAAIKDEKGTSRGMVVNLTDLTERKRLEHRLQQAQKREAIGTLAGGIAHDFNNILGIIIGNTELAMMDIPALSPARQGLEEIRKACIRARDLVKQILTFSRPSSQYLSPIHITPVIKETLKMIRSSIPTTIEIRQRIACKSDIIRANPVQVSQILINLCTNAAQAMQEKGGVLEVIVGNERLDEDKATHYNHLDPGEYLSLTVRDTGHGIEPQHLKKIFDPYFTTRGLGEGSGMGLAVVHGIVRSYGGEISVKSTPGKGSTFKILIPLAPEKAPSETVTEGPSLMPRGSEKILLVDDEQALIDVVKPMLEHLGYQVTTKMSGAAALEIFRGDPLEFDLVITDQTMPGKTGVQLTRELLQLRKDIPVILCTGFSESVSREKAKEVGIRAFLMKPVSMGELAQTIRRVLEGRKKGS